MADTIIGTAGIFFTLVLIAMASFVIGLVLYVVSDLLKSVRGQHRRHHHHASYHGAVTVSPLILADHLHRAAQHAATTLVPAGDGSEAPARWRVLVEWTCALHHMTEAHIEPRLRRYGHADAYLRTLTDLCAGNLFRAHPGPCEAPVHRLMALAREAFTAAPLPKDLFTPATALCQLLAGRIAPLLPAAPADAHRLQETVTELFRSAVTVDIAPCVK